MEDNININSSNTNEDKIKEVDLRKTMEESYLDYAMSVITDRAVPDVRDGLKPVQRRVLYALYALGVTPDKKTKKCATIVGETMGKYHPHGDSSIYGALVYMGQPWNLPHVLIDKQGNFGSEDGDGPAAMRYTEAKMSKIAAEMVDGLNKDTVEWVKNNIDKVEEHMRGKIDTNELMSDYFYMFVDTEKTGLPARTGYVYGYLKVKEYLENNNLRTKDIIDKDWKDILN